MACPRDQLEALWPAQLWFGVASVPGGHPDWAQAVAGCVLWEGERPQPGPSAQGSPRPHEAGPAPLPTPQMLATLLITRQFLQNVREVSPVSAAGPRRAWPAGGLGAARPAWPPGAQRPASRHLEPRLKRAAVAAAVEGSQVSQWGLAGHLRRKRRPRAERRPAGEGGRGGERAPGGQRREDEEE